MARKRYKPEEIVAKLRQVDVLVSQGQNMMDAIRHLLWRAAGDNVAVFGQLRDQLWSMGRLYQFPAQPKSRPRSARQRTSLHVARQITVENHPKPKRTGCLS
jgi:crotonobetainyl-CoA:carnitine CoA-transferase CaiB-like acyl-CoA transferase